MQWFFDLVRGKSIRAAHARRHAERRPVRLQLECLEDRVVPAVAGWTAPQTGWLTPAQVRQHAGFDNIWFPTPGGPWYQGDGRWQTVAIIAASSNPSKYPIDTLLQANVVHDLNTFD